MWLSVGALALALLLALYIAWLIYDAKHHVASAPREQMFVCDRHGAFPKRYAIQFQLDGVTEKPIDYCPVCYRDRMEEAKKRVG